MYSVADSCCGIIWNVSKSKPRTFAINLYVHAVPSFPDMLNASMISKVGVIDLCASASSRVYLYAAGELIETHLSLREYMSSLIGGKFP